jgi:putative two-component system response regulator
VFNTQSSDKLGVLTLNQANELISNALKLGSSADSRLVEASALQLAKFCEDVPTQIRLMLDAVRYFYLTGKPDLGLNVAECARDFAIEHSAMQSASIAHTLIGICAADTGNLPLAMEAYRDGLTLAQQTGDALQEGKVWHNLGAALAYGGLYREAIGCYVRAMEFVDIAPQLTSYFPGLYLNIAASHLNLDEPSQGLAAIKKSIDLFKNPTTQHEILNRVLAENYFTRLLIEVEDYAGATEHAKTARHYATQSKSPRSDITAAVAEGLAEVFSNQQDVGISRLTSTLVRAKALKVAAREVLVAIVKAHEHIGQHDKALVYLKEMLVTQRQTQEANALRHVARHLEQLHTKEGQAPIEDPKQAIKRLETRQEVLEGRIAKRDLFRLSVEGLERLAVATELRDDSSGEQSYRVGRLAALLAKEAGHDDDFVFMIEIAARLRDIGKIAIPDGIILKLGYLNASERQIMEVHADAGADLLVKSNIAQIQMAEEIARYHHECWDGSGYPTGLKGVDIPLTARITALADVFDALTHDRPYRQAWPVDAALIEIVSQRGKHFDPELTDLFLGLVSRLRREGINLDKFLGDAAHKSSFHQAKSKIWSSLKMANG